MRRLAGIFLVLHGLAHVGPGMWVTERGPIVAITLLWAVAMGGFMVAGFRTLGAMAGDPRLAARLASLASVALLSYLDFHPIAIAGVALDLAIFAYSFLMARGAWTVRMARRSGRWGRTVAVLLTVLFTGLVLVRPWQLRWGSRPAERDMPLPGDMIVRDARYRMDRAVTIEAPASAVWPWLVQIGQDRAGFYSYDWLERAVGADIRNSDRIVPEWQRRARGDLVRATQPNYLGGAFGRDPGWRILEYRPGEAMVLEGWGAFVVRPLDARTSRLHARMRGPGEPSWSAVAMAPLGLLVFEPAHFVMERGMLLGIKRRAEAAWRDSARAR